MYLRSFGRLRGKCASAHTCVMWRFSQVLEASFHCVTFWHHPGLPAPPSAATRRSLTDNQDYPELLQVCLSLVAMKTNRNGDAVLQNGSCLPPSYHALHVYMASVWGCGVYLFLYVQVKKQIQTWGNIYSVSSWACSPSHHVLLTYFAPDWLWLHVISLGF